MSLPTDREMLKLTEERGYNPDQPAGAPDCMFKIGDWVSVLGEGGMVYHGAVLASRVNEYGKNEVVVRRYRRCDEGIEAPERYCRLLNISTTEKIANRPEPKFKREDIVSSSITPALLLVELQQWREEGYWEYELISLSNSDDFITLPENALKCAR